MVVGFPTVGTVIDVADTPVEDTVNTAGFGEPMLNTIGVNEVNARPTVPVADVEVIAKVVPVKLTGPEVDAIVTPVVPDKANVEAEVTEVVVIVGAEIEGIDKLVKVPVVAVIVVAVIVVADITSNPVISIFDAVVDIPADVTE